MTERLYYKDPALLEFEGNIVESGIVEDKPYVVLDRSAFYPTSGGQLHDIGTLNDVKVINVTEDESGNVRHILDSKLSESKVSGNIDYDRRQYFRQLHTAQHIISRAFIDLFEYETVSVHLGEDYGAVELTVKEITNEQCSKAESFSNKIIEQSQPIEIIFADDQKAASLPLRKKPERIGTIRIIKIGELDWSACGGTHCLSTAEVGLIKVIAIEKQRGNALVKFLAGRNALADYSARFEITDSLTRQLTCAVSDIPAKFEKLTDENKQLKKQLAQAQQELLPIKVEALSNSAEQVNGIKSVIQIVYEIDPKLLNQLASETAKKIDGLTALLFESRLCVAISDNVALDAGKIVKRLSEELGLKGGGGKTLAQLGGVNEGEIEKYRKLIKSIIND